MIENADFLEFENRSAWRSWLEKHHAEKLEAWLVIQKKRSMHPGLSLDEAVEEALCFGWIDGTLNTRDDQSYLLRFSPRRLNSIWSIRNIHRIEKLQRSGKITEVGLAEVRRAKASGQWQAAIDREHTEKIPPELQTALRCKKGAIAAYRALPDSKKKQYLHWIQSAKRDETKRRRIREIVNQVLGDT
jgi:uncharacterized protein YdeI (YjbR/CyaY-like superfamily)